MGFFRDIASDARMPVIPFSGAVRPDAEFNDPAGSVKMSEVSLSPTDPMPVATNFPVENSSASLGEPLQRPSRQNPVQQISTPEMELENSTGISVKAEAPIAGLRESQAVLQVLSGQTNNLSDNGDESETSGVMRNQPVDEPNVFMPEINSEDASSQPVRVRFSSELEVASAAPTTTEKTQSAELNSVDRLPAEDVMAAWSGHVSSKVKAPVPKDETQHSIMVESDVVAQVEEIGMSADFEDFTRLSDTFHSNSLMPEVFMQTPDAVTEREQVIQTPDLTMRVRSVSRTEGVDRTPEPVTPVAATIQQADQRLAGDNRMNMSVSGTKPKAGDRNQEPRVKIGRIDVVIEAPAQKVSGNVEQKQTGDNGFSSRYYLRGV